MTNDEMQAQAEVWKQGRDAYFKEWEKARGEIDTLRSEALQHRLDSARLARERDEARARVAELEDKLARAREEQREACAREYLSACAGGAVEAAVEPDGWVLTAVRATPLDATPLADANAKLREALAETLKRWVDMANSGDAGFWDPEEEPHVIAARAALDATKEGP